MSQLIKMIASMEASDSLNSYEWDQLKKLVNKEIEAKLTAQKKYYSAKKTSRLYKEKAEYYKKRLKNG